MRGLLVLLLVAGCDKLFDIDRIEGSEGGERTRTITITRTGTTPLVDFPVSVVIATDPDLAEHARPDGRDIYFTNVDDSVLPYEVVAYSAGSLEAWVRVTLDGVTTIKLAYGGATLAGDPTRVWTGYTGVWHFAESSGDAVDSSASGFTVRAPSPGQDPGSAPGPIGNARTFVDTDDTATRQTMCATPVQRFDMMMSSFSFSAWVDIGTLVGTYDQPFAAGGYSDAYPGFGFEYSSGPLQALLTDDKGAHTQPSFGSLPSAGWAHIVAVIDRASSAARLYLDGAPVPPVAISITGSIYNELELCMAGLNGYSGKLDEVRISTQPMTSEWIAAEYANVMRRAQFIFVDAPE